MARWLAQRHTGVWRRDEGQLVVLVTGDISAGDVTAFSFSITNPMHPQESPPLSISSSGLVHLPQGDADQLSLQTPTLSLDLPATR